MQPSLFAYPALPYSAHPHTHSSIPARASLLQQCGGVRHGRSLCVHERCRGTDPGVAHLARRAATVVRTYHHGAAAQACLTPAPTEPQVRRRETVPAATVSCASAALFCCGVLRRPAPPRDVRLASPSVHARAWHGAAPARHHPAAIVGKSAAPARRHPAVALPAVRLHAWGAGSCVELKQWSSALSLRRRGVRATSRGHAPPWGPLTRPPMGPPSRGHGPPVGPPLTRRGRASPSSWRRSAQSPRSPQTSSRRSRSPIWTAPRRSPSSWRASCRR